MFEMTTKGLCYSGILAILAPLLLGQEKPLSVTGTFSTGYYNTNTRGEATQSQNFVPAGARFDLSGYLASPEFLSYSAQPELNYGPQASEAGFQGGNGIQFRISLFHKSIAPLTFRYANLQVQDVYFGGLSQVSGYTLKNRNKDLGLTWELRPNGLPATTIDWGVNSVHSRTDLAGVSDYASSGNHFNVDSKYQLAGWDLEGFLHRHQEVSDLLQPIDGGTNVGSLRARSLQYQASARRAFGRDSELYVDAGNQATSNLLFTLPIDLSTRFATANLRMFQRRRWRTSLRAAYSSNLASQLLERAAGSLGTTGAIVPDGNILAPFSHGMANLNLSGMTTVTVGHGLELFASGERSAIVSSSQETPLDSHYLTASAGATYSAKFEWGAVSAEYGRDLGVGSLTGQAGTIHGQHYLAGIQHGSPDGLQLDATVRGADQRLHTAQPLSNQSVAAEGSIAERIVGRLSVRVGGGWQWGSIMNSANDFRTDGYTARFGIEHPRFQLSASLNNTLSNSLPFYAQAFGELGPASGALLAPQIIPSDYRAMSFALHANPVRKVELSATWTRSRQNLDGFLTNDFELLNLFATYHFRKVQLEAGYIRSKQSFLYYPNTLRERIYLRILRTARLL